MNEQIQFESQVRIASYQDQLLQQAMAYLYANSAFYQAHLQACGVSPGDIQTVSDLQCVKPISKGHFHEELQRFCCVEPLDIVDYVTTSGTTGNPLTFALTESDLQRLATNEYLSFKMSNCSAEDRIQLMTTIDRRFIAGLAYYLGARKLGAGIIRVGNGIPELQWDTIERVKSNVCVVVPSFLLKLIDFAEKHGIDYRASSLKKAICIGESLYDGEHHYSALAQRIKAKWPELELFSTYASTEMQTCFTECECHRGGHLQPSLLIAECLDEQDRPVAEGEFGELTITTLGVEGMPLLRFKTGDICKLYTDSCACGRNSPRVGAIVGRQGQAIKYKGTSIYPAAFYEILDHLEYVKNYYVEVYTNDIDTDEVSICLAVDSQPLDALAKEIKDIFRSKIRVAPQIIFKDEAQIESLIQPEHSRKSKRFIDHRK